MAVATRAPAPPKRRTQGFKVIQWVEFNCVHSTAEWIGQPFRLLPWQKQWILNLFEADDAGLRRYRWALLGLPKKNGKTELAAALGLYFLIGDDEPAPIVIVAAASDEQADMVFGAAKTMCKLSPTLQQVTDPFDREILVPSSPGAKLQRVAAVAGTNDGRNIHAVICDELHEWAGQKGRNVWNVLTNGIGSRRQPMILQTTTAGYDLEGTVCGEQYLLGKAIERGEVSDPHYLFHWVEAPANCDHTDPAVWKACNPSWGHTLPNPERYLQDQLTKKTEGVFRRYFLNQWTLTEDIWEAASLWDALRSPLEMDPALPICVGIDVGVKHDCSAVVWAQARPDLEGKDRIVVRAMVWENPHPDGSVAHDEWRFQIAEVEELLRDLKTQYPAKAREKRGPAFFYDPHFFERSAQDLIGERLNMVEYPQADARMIPASQGFFELVKTGIVTHDGHQGLHRHIHNVVAEEKPRGWRISKPKGSHRNIDAAVAAAIAVHECSRPAAKRRPSSLEYAHELLEEQRKQEEQRD